MENTKKQAFELACIEKDHADRAYRNALLARESIKRSCKVSLEYDSICDSVVNIAFANTLSSVDRVTKLCMEAKQLAQFNLARTYKDYYGHDLK